MSLMIKIINGINAIKEGDTLTTVEMLLIDGNGKVYDVDGSEVKVLLSNASGKILEKPAIVGDKAGVVSFKLDEEDVTGHGVMGLEVHVVEANGIKIFPSDDTLSLKITKNINIVGEVITSISLENLKTTLGQELGFEINSVQEQINQLVVDGDSSPEAAQARVDARGVSYPTLKERIDADILLKNSSTPKGVFSTLTDLQTAKPSGDEFVYIVTSNGHWYYWNGTNWTDGGVYQSAGIAPSSVDAEKTTFLNYTKTFTNFFNKATIVTGGYYSGSTGAWVASTTANSTDYISVSQGDLIAIKSVTGGTHHVSFWNDSNTFVSGLVLTLTANVVKEYTVPPGVTKLRNAYKVGELDTFTLYKNYSFVYSNVSLKPEINFSLPNASVGEKKTSFFNISDERAINVFNKSTAQIGGYYNASVNGDFFSSSTASSSAFITATENDVFRFKSLTASNYHVTYWKADQTFLSGTVFALGVNQEASSTAPAGAYYVRIAFKTAEIDSFMITKNEPYPSRYFAYGETDFSVTLNERLQKTMILLLQDKLGSNIYGAKWGVIGDSISTVGYKGGEYPKVIADRNSIVLNNLAIPGSMITKTNVSNHLTDHMCERILLLDDDCDFISVAGGVNDLRNSVPIGTFGDTVNTTFFGALDVLCRNMISKFPDKPKCFFTPIKYRNNNTNLANYVSAIKQVAAKYAIPVFDNFNEADLQPDLDAINNTYFAQADGLHPNALGHLILARRIEHCLRNLV